MESSFTNLLNSNTLIIIFCSTIIVSYLYSIIHQKTRIPSVILLILTGILLKFILNAFHIEFSIPIMVVEILGTIGLIMIILEAGLDISFEISQTKTIKKSFLSAILNLFIPWLIIAFFLYTYTNQEFYNCLVFSLPLCIISGAIVIPSLTHLSQSKKEFLTYEASFSDVLGILLFNFLIAHETINILNVSVLFINIILSFLLAIIVSIALFYIFTRTKIQVKFFLSFAILILLYVLGKLINLPSLIVILLFGVLIKNWDKINITRLTQLFPKTEIAHTHLLLHNLTTETSFLIRTFFFILFGFSINFSFITIIDVYLIGILIIAIIFLTRYFTLTGIINQTAFPEVNFMPRGLITILLFYKIPQSMQLQIPSEGILMFVILTSNLILMIGNIIYKENTEGI